MPTNELRQAVITWWDPIGVADEWAAASEYDAYLGPIWQELRAGSPDSLAALLHGISTDQMGLSRSASDELEAAMALFAWWAESRE